MKKIYKQPLTEVVKVNAEQMICMSGFGSTLDPTEEKTDADNALGKDDGEYDSWAW